MNEHAPVFFADLTSRQRGELEVWTGSRLPVGLPRPDWDVVPVCLEIAAAADAAREIERAGRPHSGAALARASTELLRSENDLLVARRPYLESGEGLPPELERASLSNFLSWRALQWAEYHFAPDPRGIDPAKRETGHSPTDGSLYAPAPERRERYAPGIFKRPAIFPIIGRGRPPGNPKSAWLPSSIRVAEIARGLYEADGSSYLFEGAPPTSGSRANAEYPTALIDDVREAIESELGRRPTRSQVTSKLKAADFLTHPMWGRPHFRRRYGNPS